MKFTRIPAILACILFLLARLPADAATYTVTNAADVNFGGTLRWAIRSANTNPGADTIQFNLGAGASITPTGQLPSVSNAFTTIDGTTQPGYAITNLVRIYGSSAITNGLDVTGSNCTIKALAIYGFRRAGIYLHQGHHGVVQGCHLLTNGFAGLETTGYDHLIGGTNAAQRNVISANTNGIYLAQSWSNNTIIGNFIGTDVTGTLTNGNKQSGIYIDANYGNLIGSVTNGARNIICANAQGIYLNNSNAARNVIVNNYIGLASNGTTRLGNWNSGIYLDSAQRNRIGGTNVAERNYISGNLVGIVLNEAGSFSNVIQGNYIGLDAVGAAMSNDWYAIHIQHAPSNTLGGQVSGAGNVIGGGQYGVYMEGTNTCGTIIQGNKIGTDPSGSSRRGFAYTAVSLGESRFTQIGGTNDTARNLVCGAGQNGIMASSGEGGDHIIEGNYIGVDLGGTAVISNAGYGVSLNCPRCRIGGTNAANRNVISGNSSGGIAITGTNATNIVIYGNYIGMDATGMEYLGNYFDGVSVNGGAHHVYIGKGEPGCGNLLTGNSVRGVDVDQCHDVHVLNNYIGVDATGTNGVTSGSTGIRFSFCGATNYIGGLESERNVVVVSSLYGIHVYFCSGTVVRANLVGIGTNYAPIPNQLSGIQFDYSRDFEVGGPAMSDRNIVGGNRADGINMTYTSNGLVRGNFVGITPSGAAVSNSANGISLQVASGIDVADNVISANGGQGVRMSMARNCTLTGNRVGTDPAGYVDLGNGADGIYVDNTSFSNVIGGVYGAGGNVISGNGGAGIFLNGNEVSYTTIKGNKIGTDTDGGYAIGNAGDGISICGSHHAVIGGTNLNDRNIISANNWGIAMACGGVSNSQVLGNYIGVDATGTNPLPNAGCGVRLAAGTSNTTIGATNENAGNIIAFNRNGGVVVYQDQHNSILGNSIFRNEGLGIDLAADGVTANDNQDPDVGANLLQNYPVLLTATNDGATALVTGYLDSRPSRTYLVELFGSRDPDLSGFGEGQVLLGRKTVAADGSGLAPFTSTVSVVGFTPNFFTATATDADSGDTSEFSYRFLLDSDSDGMGDGYEVEYFGGHQSGDPQGQSDSDGVNNLQEFLAETDPLNGNSYLGVIRFWRESWGDRAFVAAASECRNYSVEIAWDLMGPPGLTWWDWGCSMTRTNGAVTFTEGSGSYNPMFYRVKANIP